MNFLEAYMIIAVLVSMLLSVWAVRFREKRNKNENSDRNG